MAEILQGGWAHDVPAICDLCKLDRTVPADWAYQPSRLVDGKIRPDAPKRHAGLHQAARQGGVFLFNIRDGETAAEALFRTEVEYAERSWDGGPALDENGTGAEVEPPPNIAATRDKDRLAKHLGQSEELPKSVRAGSDFPRCNLPHDAEVQFGGFYHPLAPHILDNFRAYKAYTVKGADTRKAPAKPAPITA
jgi:hypothetical protein